jgi:RNA polymerase sigma-70 factor, ECF subfamily
MPIVKRISTYPRRSVSQARAGNQVDHPASNGHDPDAHLIRRARDGNLDAYAELTDRHGPLAYRVALRLLGNRQDAEDVTREALVAAWQQLPAFRESSGDPAWLLRLVTQRALLRTTPDGAAATDEVAAAVAGLAPPQRVAIVLHHFEGFSAGEVARITASTVPAVRDHLCHGRRALTRGLRARR